MATDTDAPLLQPGEPAPFHLLNPAGKSPLALVCDHADNRVPRQLNNLGLNPDQLASHIGWDPGAAQVARALSAILDAPLVLSSYSRLVIDCNRPLASPESIPDVSAGIPIPGNQNLTATQREQRVRALYRPYQQAIATLLQPPGRFRALLSIHSFTPELNGEQRPWHIGVSAYREPRLARALFEQLQREAGLKVGFNLPYAIEAEYDYTVPAQGEARGLHSAMIEIRQDGIGNAAQAAAWADRLARAWNKWNKWGQSC